MQQEGNVLRTVIKNVSKVTSFAAELSEAKDIVVAHANECLEYYYSQERQIEMEMANRIEKSYKRIRIISSILCIVLIGITVVCYVTGNDIILDYLHL